MIYLFLGEEEFTFDQKEISFQQLKSGMNAMKVKNTDLQSEREEERKAAELYSNSFRERCA